MSLIPYRRELGAATNPSQGHPPSDACWWCADEALLNAAARGETPLPRPLHLDTAWQHCPNLPPEGTGMDNQPAGGAQ